MKKITLFFILCFGLSVHSQTISHSNSMDLGTTNVACNAGTGATATSSENRYFRFFNLSSFSITEAYGITSVQFGIQSLNIPTLPAGFPVRVRIFSTPNTDFPTGYPTGYSEVAQVTTNILPANVETIVSIPITGTIPAGSNLLVEVGYAAQEAASGNRIFFSANSLGQTAPTYIQAPTCGITAPTTMTAINFPNAHLVLSVTGSTLSLNDSKLNQISVYPNPSKGDFTVSLPVGVSIEKASVVDMLGKQMSISIDANNSFSISQFNSGVYLLNIETSEGVLNTRIVKQ
ncbi:MAG: T9SS type A sorting domain-containing protein [Flavobacterium sp.]